MERAKSFKLSLIALILSILPLATLIPTVLHFSVSDGVRTVWSAANILFVLGGLVLSVICVKSKESRSPVNIISTALSCFWLLLVVGILIFALVFSSF